MKEVSDRCQYLFERRGRMFNDFAIERFTREFASQFYLRCDDDESLGEVLDRVENIATYGNNRVPLDWIIQDEEDKSLSEVLASDLLSVIDDHAKMLVTYMSELFEYIEGLEES